MPTPPQGAGLFCVVAGRKHVPKPYQCRVHRIGPRRPPSHRGGPLPVIASGATVERTTREARPDSRGTRALRLGVVRRVVVATIPAGRRPITGSSRRVASIPTSAPRGARSGLTVRPAPRHGLARARPRAQAGKKRGQRCARRSHWRPSSESWRASRDGTPAAFLYCVLRGSSLSLT